MKILGINQDESSCACCNKTNLQRVVWLKDNEGNISHFGTVCASRLMGQKKIKNAIKKIDKLAYYQKILDQNDTELLRRHALSIEYFGGFKALWGAHWIARLDDQNKMTEINPQYLSI